MMAKAPDLKMSANEAPSSDSSARAKLMTMGQKPKAKPEPAPKED